MNFILNYLISPLLIVFSICVYIYAHKENIKTYFVLQKEIDVDLPQNYTKSDLEDAISKVAYNGWSQGVHVLYAPPQFGKTTSIKKVLKEMQKSKATTHITFHDYNNNKSTKKFQFKPVYIDGSQELSQKPIDFFKKMDFIKTIPENTKVVIVLDHMSKNVLDGFVEYDKNKIKGPINAEMFYDYYAVDSYNGGLKYVMIVITNDKEYATNILQINGCTKVYQIRTSLDKSGQLHSDACKLHSEKMKIRMANCD